MNKRKNLFNSWGVHLVCCGALLFFALGGLGIVTVFLRSEWFIAALVFILMIVVLVIAGLNQK